LKSTINNINSMYELENLLKNINSMSELEKVWKRAHEIDDHNEDNSPIVNGEIVNKNNYIKDGFLTMGLNSADILFVLKEANLDSENKAIFWFQCVLNNECKDNAPRYKEKLTIINNFLTQNDIKNAAYININKRGGNGSTNNDDLKKLKQYAYDYKLFIKKQIELINPKYILCAGCFNIFVKNILLELEPYSRKKWMQKLRNTNKYFEGKFGLYFEYNDGKNNLLKIIDVYHPSARGYNVKKYEDRFKMHYEEIKGRL